MAFLLRAVRLTTRMVASQASSMFLNAPAADGGQQGDAVGGALLGVDRDDVLAEDVGLDLPPERALAAAAGGADLLHGDAQLFDDRQAVAHGVGHAFHDAADQVAAGVRERQADEAAAGERIGVRRALAGEIRAGRTAPRCRRRLSAASSVRTS